MAVAVPMISEFTPAPQAKMQEIVVPSVPTQTNYYEQPHVTYQANCEPWVGAYSTSPGAYYGSEAYAANYMYSDRGYCAAGDWSNPERFHADGYYYGNHRARHSRIPNYAAARSGNAPANWHSDRTAIGAAARFQQPAGKDDDNLTVSVVIENLPKVLCSDACLKVALEIAGVDDAVKLFAVADKSATVIVNSELAAQKVMKHFGGLKGDANAVTVRYCAAAGKKLMESKEPKQEQPKETVQETNPSPQVAPAATVENKRIQRKVAAATATTPLVLTRVALKQRWADFDFDDDSDSDDYNSTAADSSPVPSKADSETSSNSDELEASQTSKSDEL